MNISHLPKVGVMQGRLSSKVDGKYQAYPENTWKEEFSKARELGFSTIEWIVDAHNFESNALVSKKNWPELQTQIANTGVGIKSVCADCLMQTPLTSESVQEQEVSSYFLNTLIEIAPNFGIENIVIPLVDKSSLSSIKREDQFAKILEQFLPLAEKNKVNLALESDFAPQKFFNFLNRQKHDFLKVNYDIGNSASLGYSVKEEFDAYGQFISDIHIKDRILGGGSVELGTGNANFKEFFSALQRINYTGIFIYQAYRDDEGIDILKKQIQYFNPKLYSALHSTL